MSRPRDPNSRISRVFAAIQASGKTEFTPREWMRLINTVAEDNSDRHQLANSLQRLGYTERLVRMTPKGKERAGA